LLLLQLGVAKELGYTLARLNREVTLEELLLAIITNPEEGKELDMKSGKG
jgi:hypothetical protein